MRVLCIHGVGDHRPTPDWYEDWGRSVRISLQRAGRDVDTDFLPVNHDELFEDYPITFQSSARALRQLLGSGTSQLWRSFSAEEGLFDGASQALRATAGMVVLWVENETLRAQLRQLVSNKIDQFRPDVILGHSLGSLIAYDFLTHPDGRGALDGGTFVSFGSQIGNPFVVGNFLAGRIEPIPNVQWYHLFNRYDDVFTSSIRLQSPAFTQIETPFGEWWSLDHDATKYLEHDNAVARLWSAIPEEPTERIPAWHEMVESRAPRKRALLVGINDYPDPRHRLQGAVNDVFLISSVLQECGFSPDSIRLLVNERATAPAIRERLEWLLQDAQEGDQLFFHFSGHGVAIPGYNAETVVDRIHECLVPYNFDGSLESTIADEQIYKLYSNLPYGVHFIMNLDCCHAGGQARAGASVRGIDPPEDIRHRNMRWDADRELWVSRALPPLSPRFSSNEEKQERFAGPSGSTLRLGRAMQIRPQTDGDTKRSRSQRDHLGPYMPTILQACGDQEQAFEYYHGGAAYGAFTFALAHCLRRLSRGSRRKAPTMSELVEQAASVISEDLHLPQSVSIVGPEQVVSAAVPLLR